MDEFEQSLRTRLRTAAAEVGRTIPAAHPRGAIRRGLFMHRLHVASLGAVAAAAIVVVSLAATHTPVGSALRPDGSGLISILPLPTLTGDPSPRPTTKPTPSESPTFRPSPSPRPSDSVPPKPRSSPVPFEGCPPYGPVDPPAGMNVSLRTLKTVFARGEPIAMTLAVSNDGVVPVTNWRPSGQRYDFFIMQGRTVVWKWSDGKVFTQALEKETFAPGEKREATEAWDQTRCDGLDSDSALAPGKYLAYGLWTTMTDEGTRGWWSDPIGFEIV